MISTCFVFEWIHEIYVCLPLLLWWWVLTITRRYLLCSWSTLKDLFTSHNAHCIYHLPGRELRTLSYGEHSLTANWTVDGVRVRFVAVIVTIHKSHGINAVAFFIYPINTVCFYIIDSFYKFLFNTKSSRHYNDLWNMLLAWQSKAIYGFTKIHLL